MKINVTNISEIEVHHDMSAPPTFDINVGLREHQARNILSQLIIDYGETEVLQWIEKDR